jgi:hypothetical protein
MKRNLEIIKKLLLAVEENGATDTLDNEEQYQALLLHDAGFVKLTEGSPVNILRLTWQGHIAL